MAANFEHYKIFYYVARYGSFTKAAELLYSNQPNVTRIIRILESELGCTLMNRSNRGITLTEEGERLYRRVAAAFEQIELGEEEVRQSAALESGTVVIGASETALHLYLMEILRTFHEAYPGVRLKIYNYSTPGAAKAMKEGLIDLAVVTAADEKELEGAADHVVLVKTFYDVLIAGSRLEYLADQKNELKDLAQYSLIILERHTSSYEFYSQFYLENGLTMRPDIEVATADLILPMVEKNLGIGFLPYELAEQALEEGRVFEIPLKESIPERRICMLYDTKREIGAAGRRFREMVVTRA
ncbi:LysR family transcriptional regulator [Ventrimonas sp. CLA-AP-H27]|uniref:LysR family transcriptional regulator n=1 Tax=Ventrimonas faecis TaxID=3133170 RepID=A0ABV1HHI4_9FIRM